MYTDLLGCATDGTNAAKVWVNNKNGGFSTQYLHYSNYFHNCFFKKTITFQGCPRISIHSIPSNMGFVDFNGDCHADVAIQTHDVLNSLIP